MRIFNLALSLLYLIIPNLNYGQIMISGNVKDSITNENLIGAYVLVKDKNSFTTTNEGGYFNIKCDKITDTLVISYVGYKDHKVPLSFIGEMPITIKLSQSTLDEVTIVASKFSTLKQAEIQLSTGALESIPIIGGEPDIIKALFLLPGLSQGAEGSSQLYVRGGTPDQNLMLLDGIQVYNANHLGGFFSTFNPNAVNSVNIYKSRFPARYGGRLSSIIDVTSKNGSFEKFSGNISAGILTSSLTMGGPVIKDKLKFHLSARSSYLGLVNLFRDKNKLSDYLDYWLYDINFNTTWKLKKGEVIFGIYTGNDIANTINKSSSNSGGNLIRASQTDAELKWGNKNAYLKYRAPIYNSAFLNLTVASTQYKFNHENISKTVNYLQDSIVEMNSYTNKSEVADALIILMFDFNLFKNIYFKTGTNYTLHNYGTYSQYNLDLLSTKINSTELSAFMESTISYDKFESDIGFRIVNYKVNGISYSGFEPRIAIGYHFNHMISWYIDYSKNTQFIHLLSDQTFGLPVDIWVPATPNAMPSTAMQFSSGLSYKLKKYSLKADIYFKEMSNLITFKSSEDSPFNRIGNWESSIENNGIGKSYGMELLFEFTQNHFSGFVSYALSKSTRQFSKINDNNPFPFLFDRRHDLALNTSLKLSESTQLNINYVFQTGNPITLPVAVIPTKDGTGRLHVFTTINNGRLPVYNRMDVGLIHNKKLKNNKEIKFIFSIYNLLNRRNPNAVLIDSKPVFNADGNYLYNIPDIKSISYFPIIPGASINYTL